MYWLTLTRSFDVFPTIWCGFVTPYYISNITPVSASRGEAEQSTKKGVEKNEIRKLEYKCK